VCVCVCVCVCVFVCVCVCVCLFVCVCVSYSYTMTLNPLISFYRTQIEACIAIFRGFKITLWPLVLERTIPTGLPPRVGEVSVNFLRIEDATWPAWRIPTAAFFCFLDRGHYLFFFTISSSVVLTRLSEPHSRPTTSQKIW
jgi:hypothetical protein